MVEANYSFKNIQDLVVSKTGCNEEDVTLDCDIVDDLGCVGDDLDELLSEYSSRFNVQMDSYLWYFHSEDEAHLGNIGRHFFKPPYERVLHIPVTPRMLLQSAKEGKWLVAYPEHTLPKRRYDVFISWGIGLVVILFSFFTCSS
ncbi:DUF1493 family protein [Lacibacter sp. H407]|uniref:DUF1493 family protein n=1 Tax=Lacibacter sp. H407 TaxID=3133423 RepID=UPI0030BB9081